MKGENDEGFWAKKAEVITVCIRDVIINGNPFRHGLRRATSPLKGEASYAYLKKEETWRPLYAGAGSPKG